MAVRRPFFEGVNHALSAPQRMKIRNAICQIALHFQDSSTWAAAHAEATMNENRTEIFVFSLRPCVPARITLYEEQKWLARSALLVLLSGTQ